MTGKKPVKMRQKIELEEIAGSYALCSLRPGAAFPSGLTRAFWASLPDECSLLCPEEEVPEDAAAVETGYRALRVKGTLDLGLVGILARISAVLSAADIPLCAVSTYNTDYIFVPGHLLDGAVRALEREDMPVKTLADGEERE